MRSNSCLAFSIRETGQEDVETCKNHGKSMETPGKTIRAEQETKVLVEISRLQLIYDNLLGLATAGVVSQLPSAEELSAGLAHLSCTASFQCV